MEDWVYVLDYLPEGRPDLPPHRRQPIAYGIGEKWFTLLELVPKPSVKLSIGERVWVGKDLSKRDKILKVKGRIGYDSLGGAAHSEIPYIIMDIVKKDEQRFINFFNEAPPISTRFHSLELLPGLGKKIMNQALEERKKGSFKGFEDLKQRVPLLHQPDKLIARRIEIELSDPHQKYHIFTK
jgi:putative nucleotide binding protein